MVGSIYLAKIYFTNGTEYKLRPILIVQKNSFGDLIYIPFSTNASSPYALEFCDDFLQDGTFRKQSYLILDKTCTITPNLMTKQIATIKVNRLQEIVKHYCEFLKT